MQWPADLADGLEDKGLAVVAAVRADAKVDLLRVRVALEGLRERAGGGERTGERERERRKRGKREEREESRVWGRRREEREVREREVREEKRREERDEREKKS